MISTVSIVLGHDDGGRDPILLMMVVNDPQAAVDFHERLELHREACPPPAGYPHMSNEWSEARESWIDESPLAGRQDCDVYYENYTVIHGEV